MIVRMLADAVDFSFNEVILVVTVDFLLSEWGWYMALIL